MLRKPEINRILCSEGLIFDKFEEKEPSKINFNNLEADIVVLAHQPGIGKTFSVLNFMEKEKDSFYFTTRHEVIEENIRSRGWNEGFYSHWKGFGKLCKEETHKELSMRGIPPKILCSICKQRGHCDYLSQFKNRKRVFAPYEFLNTSYSSIRHT